MVAVAEAEAEAAEGLIVEVAEVVAEGVVAGVGLSHRY